MKPNMDFKLSQDALRIKERQDDYDFEMNILLKKMQILCDARRGLIISVNIDISPPTPSRQSDILTEFFQWCMNRSIIPDAHYDHNETGDIFISVNSNKI